MSKRVEMNFLLSHAVEKSTMAVANIKDYLRVLLAALHEPEGLFWTSYDEEPTSYT